MFPFLQTPTPVPLPRRPDPFIDGTPPHWIQHFQTWFNSQMEPGVYWVVFIASMSVWWWINRQAKRRRARLEKLGKQETPVAFWTRNFLFSKGSIWLLLALGSRTFGAWFQTAVTVVTLYVLWAIGCFIVAAIYTYGYPPARDWYINRRDHYVRTEPRKKPTDDVYDSKVFDDMVE